jgi:hypothetical protein
VLLDEEGGHERLLDLDQRDLEGRALLLPREP